MTRDELREIFEWAERRDQTLYAWLRHLLLMAGGALTVLVSLHTGKQSTGIALVCIRIAWVSLGSGILLGSLRLYGEVWTEREKVKLLVKQKTERDPEDGSEPSPIVVRQSKAILWSESLCYIALIVAVVSLVGYAMADS